MYVHSVGILVEDKPSRILAQLEGVVMSATLDTVVEICPSTLT
jgi:hypothetical protein